MTPRSLIDVQAEVVQAALALHQRRLYAEAYPEWPGADEVNKAEERLDVAIGRYYVERQK